MTLPPRASAPLLRAALTALLAVGAGAQAQTVTPAAATKAATSSLTLDAALALLSGSPSVTQAQLSVQVAQKNLDAARTALGLTVSVTGNAAYTGPGSSTAEDGTTTALASSLSGSAGVNVSLGLLPWSSNQSSLRAAQRSLNLAQANLQEAGASARLNVYQQYYEAVLATADINLAARTLALRQRQLTVAQTQRTSGNATAETVLSAQAALQAAQAEQVQAAASLDAARRSLGAALGQTVSAGTFPTTPPATVTLPDVATLVARARASRSEVVQARNTLASAQDDLDEQNRSRRLPDITASVRYGAGSGGLNANLNLTQGTVGAGYSVPFGGDTSASAGSASNRVSASISGSYVVYSPAASAQVSAAQASVTQAQLSLTVEQQTVELEVRTRYATLQSSIIAVQAKATAVQVAQTALNTATARLAAGTGTADDVASAELDLAQAQRDLVSARVTAQLNLLQLVAAAGGPA